MSYREQPRKYRVRSKSHPDKFHIVMVWKDGGMYCDCMAGSMKKPCRHKDIVGNYLKKLNTAGPVVQTGPTEKKNEKTN